MSEKYTSGVELKSGKIGNVVNIQPEALNATLDHTFFLRMQHLTGVEGSHIEHMFKNFSYFIIKNIFIKQILI